MRQYIDTIILPYVCQKRKELKLPPEQPAVMIFDNFKGQCTEELLNFLDSNNIDVILIPPNCTDRLQPLDLSIKGAMRPRSFVKPFKIFTSSEIIIVAYTYGNLRIPI